MKHFYPNLTQPDDSIGFQKDIQNLHNSKTIEFTLFCEKLQKPRARSRGQSAKWARNLKNISYI